MVYRLLNLIRPPSEMTPDSLQNWRWNMVIAMLAFGVFAGWSVSPFGFVRADEVDAKVTAAIEPVQQQIKNLQAKFDATAAETKEIKQLLLRKLIEDKVRDIRNAKRQQCKASDLETAAYFRDLVAEGVLDYTELTGREYRPPSCSEL